MVDVPYQRPKYYALIIAGLSLFGFSIALSKSASNIFIGLTVIAILFLLVRHSDFRNSVSKNIRQPLLFPLVLFLSVAVLGLLYTTDLFHGFGIVNKIIGLLLVYLMVSTMLDSVDDTEATYTKRALVAFLIGIFALDVIAMLTYLGIIEQRKYFLPLYPLHVHHIWFSNLNSIGIYTVVAIWFFSGRRIPLWKKLLFIGFVLMAVSCILLSLSRTAWNGLFVTVIVLTIVFLKNKKKVYFAILCLLTGGVLLYLFNDIVHTRLNLIVSDITSYSRGETYTNIGARFLLWEASYKMFLSSPVFGVGTGDFVSTVNNYMATGNFPRFLVYFNQPHNMYLFTLATNGLIGLSALFYIFFAALKFGISTRDESGSKKMFSFLTIATVVHFMVGGLTDSFFNIQMLRYTFGFMMGVCLRSSLRAESGKLRSNIE